MKLTCSSVVFPKTGFVLLVIGLGLILDPSPILFESLESKTLKGDPVFNEISYSFLGREVWTMRQSHKGLTSKPETWDRLTLEVKNGQAIFRQHQPGSIKDAIQAPLAHFTASCFMCHSNGPRMIRPKWDSENIKVSYWNQVRLKLWNFRISNQGPIESSSAPTHQGAEFRILEPSENRVLQVKTCARCHAADSLTRGPLRQQNGSAIKFLVDQGLMPPAPYTLSSKERTEIKKFIMGI